MAGVFFFILILGVVMAMLGTIDKRELPSGLKFLAEDRAVAPVATTTAVPGFGTTAAPAWYDGWKLYLQDGSFVAGRKLLGSYRDFDAPDLSLACRPGGRVQIFVDSRLPLAGDGRILLADKPVAEHTYTATWHQLHLNGRHVPNGASLALPYAAGTGHFKMPDNVEAVQQVLGETCRQQARSAAAPR